MDHNPLCGSISDTLWWEAYCEWCTYTFNTVIKPNTWFSLSCCIQINSWERSSMCIIQIWSSSTLWLNKDQKSWYMGFESNSTPHFLRTNHSLCLRSSTCVHHCDTDCVDGMMPFVPLFGAENESFGTNGTKTIYHRSSAVILGLSCCMFSHGSCKKYLEIIFWKV